MSNDKIKIDLFGQGKILLEDREVPIPRGKLTGLVFYLALKKTASRDELCFLFWPDSSDKKAKSSLRNALHKLKSYMGLDLIARPNNSILKLNSNLDLVIDVDEFEKNPKANLDLYDDLLQGFYIKGLDELELFLSQKSAYYQDIYVKTAENTLKEDYDLKNFQDLEYRATRLLIKDPYNTKAYYYLMSAYRDQGFYDRLINLFYDYKDLIEKDLEAPLDPSIVQLKDQTLKFIGSKNSKNHKESDFIGLGREWEASRILENIGAFKKGQDFKSLVISGDYGTGKSKLIDHVLGQIDQDMVLIDLRSLPIDGHLFYSIAFKLQTKLLEEFSRIKNPRPDLEKDLAKLFDDQEAILPSIQITEKIENYDSSRVFNTLNQALSFLSQEKLVIVLIEDVQWLDRGSIQLIGNLLMQEGKNIFYILSLEEKANEYAYNFFGPLVDHGRLESIRLKNYSKSQVKKIAKTILDPDLDLDIIDNLYDKSKGNPFFLFEYIGLYQKSLPEEDIVKNIQGILADKMARLTESQWDLVKVLSVCLQEIEIDYLVDILGQDPFDTIRDIACLSNLNIITEISKADSSYIDFSYQAYKDYVYQSLSKSQHQVLHRLIATYLENNLGQARVEDPIDIDDHTRLSYHFGQAKDRVKALKYEVNILNYRLYFNHEVYPDLTGYKLGRSNELYASNIKSQVLIQETESKILKLKAQSPQDKDDLEDIEMRFLMAKGRFLIRTGSYKEGIRSLDQLIAIAKSRANQEMELLGYKQSIVAGIQRDDPPMMKSYLDSGIGLAQKIGDGQEKGIFHRLYGLYYLMLGDFDSANEFFDKALEYFQDPRGVSQVNRISIAAIYNYKGEIQNSRLDHKKALKYFKKAIDLCEGLDANCQSIFHINGGITAFLMGDYKKMEAYLKDGLAVVRRFDSYWKASMLYAFLGLSMYMAKDYDKAQSLLERAQLESNTIEDPRDIGTIYFVDAIIKKDMEAKTRLGQENLRSYLNEASLVYYFNANKYLSDKRDRALVEYLKKEFVQDKI